MAAGAPVTHEQYAAWRQAIFGDPYLVWHDGPMFHALIEAARSDLDGVTRMLGAGIHAKDPIAAQCVGVLATEGLTAPGAETVLREAVATATGTMRVRLAEALYVITADPAWGRHIASVLTDDEFWADQIDAAIALANFRPTAELVAALTAGVCSEEYLVRYHSATTLLKHAGRPGTVSDYPIYFDRIRTPPDGPPTAADRAARRSVAEELVALIR
jgi:hypothetical protein